LQKPRKYSKNGKNKGKSAARMTWHRTIFDIFFSWEGEIGLKNIYKIPMDPVALKNSSRHTNRLKDNISIYSARSY